MTVRGGVVSLHAFLPIGWQFYCPSLLREEIRSAIIEKGLFVMKLVAKYERSHTT